MSDLITVIIPCYKQCQYLPEAVSSLQAQTYSNWEAIIVNDGSPDNTEQIAKALCGKDERIHYISKSNGGLSSARNAGLSVAQGDWIQFLDADDLLLPEKFARHMRVVQEKGAGSLSYTDYTHGCQKKPIEYKEGYRLDHRFLLSRPLLDMAVRWESEFSIPIHAFLLPAWLFHEKKLQFDVTLPNHEDWDIWMQVFSHIDSVIFIPEILAVYRINPNSMSRNRFCMWNGFRMAIEKQLKLYGADGDVRRALQYLVEINDYLHFRGFRGKVKRVIDSRLFRNGVMKGIASRVRHYIHPQRPTF